DDEGIDLILSSKGGQRSVFVQVKSRFNLSKGRDYKTQVKRKSFVPRAGFYLLFVFYDTDNSQLGDSAWLIPSLDFERNLQGQSPSSSIYVFQSRFDSKDMWESYRLKLRDLPRQLSALVRG